MAKYRGVEGGTPADTKRLCDSCSHGQVLRTESSQEIVYCNVSIRQAIQIHVRVVECSKYSSIGEQSIWAMEKSAWILETKRGQPIGFVSPAEFRKRHEDEDIVPDRYHY